ncbi:hypothetical protein [Variovorax guangxiensis]|uniref:Uncharacterized protein n=1 Tax=Variovorax guangxiensis TaxID=1775474 RepID=A0A840FXZ5_9BURK|nr:hypothetical protein [Variovorax guangxiensis]MBB4223947.1 hypothetical protein [Variovorax guangxiensis]
MKYQATIDQINLGKLTRDELRTMRSRAQAKLDEGDTESRTVLQALDSAVAKDSGIIFMGFCPNGDLTNRLDDEWKRQGICTFDFDDSKDQMNLFRGICAGDLIILKKSEKFGQTMSLHGHGRVVGTDTGPDGRRLLKVNWSPAGLFPSEVPMMGCQSTVNLRSMQTVEGAMPHEFFEWANLPRSAST